MSKKNDAAQSAKVSQSVELVNNSITVSSDGKYLIIVKAILDEFPEIIKTDKKTGKEEKTGRVHVSDYKPFTVTRNEREFRITTFVTTTKDKGIKTEKKTDKHPVKVKAFSI